MGSATGTDNFVRILSASESAHIDAPDALGLHLLIHRSGGVHTPPLSALACSPISPHCVKPRTISDSFSSESSGSGSTESLPEFGDENDHRVGATQDIKNCSLVLGNETAVGTATSSLMDSVSLKTESDGANTVSTGPEEDGTTKPDGSPRSDSSSERSNSDVEIYLDTQGLNNTAMRMTSIRNNPTSCECN